MSDITRSNRLLLLNSSYSCPQTEEEEKLLSEYRKTYHAIEEGKRKLTEIGSHITHLQMLNKFEYAQELQNQIELIHEKIKYHEEKLRELETSDLLHIILERAKLVLIEKGPPEKNNPLPQNNRKKSPGKLFISIFIAIIKIFRAIILPIYPWGFVGTILLCASIQMKMPVLGIVSFLLLISYIAFVFIFILDIFLDKVPTNNLKKQPTPEKVKKRYFCTRVLSLCLSCISMVALFFWLTPNVFTKEVTIEESYVVDKEIETYVCYTTATGECYHSRTCQYVGYSAYKTTVYSAKLRGYRSCSRCRPREATTIIVQETLTRPITKQETNYFASIALSLCISVVIYNLIVFIPRKNYKKVKEQT